ncbi:MAG: branched-chain amino acid ABC transporter permease [Acidobacteriota bacterium]
MNYLWHILNIVGIYAILAASLNLVAGYTGLLSLCHAAFYGLGAYITTLLMVGAGLNFFWALGCAILLTAVSSLLISAPSLRLRGDYFVLATLGFQIIVFSILYNWVGLTRGPYGIAGIPAPRVFGFEVDSVPRFFVFTTLVGGATLGLVWLIAESPFGRVLRAIRDDELAAAALGKNVTTLKTTAFVLAACLAAIPGGLFAAYMRYIDPTSFTLTESIFIVSMVVIGGAGSFAGPLAGAAVMVLVPEALRFLQIPDSVAANLRQVVYGLLLIVLMRMRSRGLMGEYDFE